MGVTHAKLKTNNIGYVFGHFIIGLYVCIDRPTRSMFTINLSQFDMHVYCVCGNAIVKDKDILCHQNWKTRCYWHYQRPRTSSVASFSPVFSVVRIIVTNVRYFADFSFCKMLCVFSSDTKKVLFSRRFSIHRRYKNEIIKICCVKRHHLVRVATHLNVAQQLKHFREKFISFTKYIAQQHNAQLTLVFVDVTQMWNWYCDLVMKPNIGPLALVVFANLWLL